MRRTLPLICVLIGLLACSAAGVSSAAANQNPSARALVVAGHNPPTRMLEAAYKIALLERKSDPQGCYPPATELASILRKKTSLKIGVASGTRQVTRQSVVYVLKSTRCSRLIMSLRFHSDVYVLDSEIGTIRVLGQAPTSDRGKNGRPRGLSIVTSTARLSAPDSVQRLEARCPGGKYPLGGAMSATPNPGPDGEGVYPHSYERLGAQRGWHVSVTLLDASRASTVARTATVQVVCASGLISANPSPHKTVFIKPGETKSATARCPGGQQLVTGGFQRSDFRSDGGDYITESRAVGTNAWKVTGHAFGTGAGELSSIAYCVRSKRPLLTEVSSTAIPVPSLGNASTTTPSCPGGTRLTTGGFSENGSQSGFFSNGVINSDNTWTASAFGYFGAVPSLTAYGYCLKA